MNAVSIGDCGADARSNALEATEPRSAAAVTGNLLIEKSVRAGAGESTEQWQMLGHCAVEVKLITGLIVSRAVLGAEVKTGKCGQLKAVLAAEVAGRRAPRKSSNSCQRSTMIGPAPLRLGRHAAGSARA